MTKIELKETLFRWLMRGYVRLFARPAWHVVNRFLFNLSLRGLGILNNQGSEDLISKGEANFLQRIAPQWESQPVVLDVGAHHGAYASLVKRYCQTARVFAFEPNPEACALLQRRALDEGFVAIEQGCGERTEKVLLYDYETKAGSVHASLYPDVLMRLHRENAVSREVQLLALDDFLDARQLSRVALVKIDTEGHELHVLKGLHRALAQNLIDVVQFEFNAMNVYSRVFLRDFYELLPAFEFYRLLPSGVIPLGEYCSVPCELFAYQNLVAVRKGCGVQV
ncbi:MAG: FkbM family methyltransferase [Nitrospiraceae bacterium]